MRPICKGQVPAEEWKMRDDSDWPHTADLQSHQQEGTAPKQSPSKASQAQSCR